MKIPKHMQAVVYRGPDTLSLETVPVPPIRPDELLVKVGVCGVCPTDIKKIQKGTVAPPRVFGHETAGVVAQVGSRLQGFRVGDRVALHHHVPCLDCHACRHHDFAQCPQYKRTGITAGFEPAGGGYAEYVRVMSFVLPGVVRIPKKNDLIEGGMLEPVNTVLKGIRRLHLLPGDRVLVVGQGPIGLLFSRLLTLEGIDVFATDLLAARRRMAKGWGASRVWAGDDPALVDKLDRASRRQPIDAAVVTIPSCAAARQAASAIRGGASILLFGHTTRGDECPIDLGSVCVDEKSWIGSYSSDVTLQKKVAQKVFRRALDVRSLVTDTFPLAETTQAIELAADPSPTTLKTMVVQK